MKSTVLFSVYIAYNKVYLYSGYGGGAHRRNGEEEEVQHVPATADELQPQGRAEDDVYAHAQPDSYAHAQKDTYVLAQKDAYAEAQKEAYGHAPKDAYAHAQQNAYARAQEGAHESAYQQPSLAYYKDIPVYSPTSLTQNIVQLQA